MYEGNSLSDNLLNGSFVLEDLEDFYPNINDRKESTIEKELFNDNEKEILKKDEGISNDVDTSDEQTLGKDTLENFSSLADDVFKEFIDSCTDGVEFFSSIAKQNQRGFKHQEIVPVFFGYKEFWSILRSDNREKMLKKQKNDILLTVENCQKKSELNEEALKNLIGKVFQSSLHLYLTSKFKEVNIKIVSNICTKLQTAMSPFRGKLNCFSKNHNYLSIKNPNLKIFTVLKGDIKQTEKNLSRLETDIFELVSFGKFDLAYDLCQMFYLFFTSDDWRDNFIRAKFKLQLVRLNLFKSIENFNVKDAGVMNQLRNEYFTLALRNLTLACQEIDLYCDEYLKHTDKSEWHWGCCWVNISEEIFSVATVCAYLFANLQIKDKSKIINIFSKLLSSLKLLPEHKIYQCFDDYAGYSDNHREEYSVINELYEASIGNTFVNDQLKYQALVACIKFLPNSIYFTSKDNWEDYSGKDLVVSKEDEKIFKKFFQSIKEVRCFINYFTKEAVDFCRIKKDDKVFSDTVSKQELALLFRIACKYYNICPQNTDKIVQPLSAMKEVGSKDNTSLESMEVNKGNNLLIELATPQKGRSHKTDVRQPKIDAKLDNQLFNFRRSGKKATELFYKAINAQMKELIMEKCVMIKEIGHKFISYNEFWKKLYLHKNGVSAISEVINIIKNKSKNSTEDFSKTLLKSAFYLEKERLVYDEFLKKVSEIIREKYEYVCNIINKNCHDNYVCVGSDLISSLREKNSQSVFEKFQQIEQAILNSGKTDSCFQAIILWQIFYLFCTGNDRLLQINSLSKIASLQMDKIFVEKPRKKHKRNDKNTNDFPIRSNGEEMNDCASVLIEACKSVDFLYKNLDKNEIANIARKLFKQIMIFNYAVQGSGLTFDLAKLHKSAGDLSRHIFLQDTNFGIKGFEKNSNQIWLDYETLKKDEELKGEENKKLKGKEDEKFKKVLHLKDAFGGKLEQQAEFFIFCFQDKAELLDILYTCKFPGCQSVRLFLKHVIDTCGKYFNELDVQKFLLDDPTCIEVLRVFELAVSLYCGKTAKEDQLNLQYVQSTVENVKGILREKIDKLIEKGCLYIEENIDKKVVKELNIPTEKTITWGSVVREVTEAHTFAIMEIFSCENLSNNRNNKKYFPDASVQIVMILRKIQKAAGIPDSEKTDNSNLYRWIQFIKEDSFDVENKSEEEQEKKSSSDQCELNNEQKMCVIVEIWLLFYRLDKIPQDDISQVIVDFCNLVKPNSSRVEKILRLFFQLRDPKQDTIQQIIDYACRLDEPSFAVVEQIVVLFDLLQKSDHENMKKIVVLACKLRESTANLNGKIKKLNFQLDHSFELPKIFDNNAINNVRKDNYRDIDFKSFITERLIRCNHFGPIKCFVSHGVYNSNDNGSRFNQIMLGSDSSSFALILAKNYTIIECKHVLDAIVTAEEFRLYYITARFSNSLFLAGDLLPELKFFGALYQIRSWSIFSNVFGAITWKEAPVYSCSDGTLHYSPRDKHNLEAKFFSKDNKNEIMNFFKEILNEMSGCAEGRKDEIKKQANYLLDQLNAQKVFIAKFSDADPRLDVLSGILQSKNGHEFLKGTLAWQTFFIRSLSPEQLKIIDNGKGENINLNEKYQNSKDDEYYELLYKFVVQKMYGAPDGARGTLWYLKELLREQGNIKVAATLEELDNKYEGFKEKIKGGTFDHRAVLRYVFQNFVITAARTIRAAKKDIKFLRHLVASVCTFIEHEDLMDDCLDDNLRRYIDYLFSQLIDHSQDELLQSEADSIVLLDSHKKNDYLSNMQMLFINFDAHGCQFMQRVFFDLIIVLLCKLQRSTSTLKNSGIVEAISLFKEEKPNAILGLRDEFLQKAESSMKEVQRNCGSANKRFNLAMRYFDGLKQQWFWHKNVIEIFKNFHSDNKSKENLYKCVFCIVVFLQDKRLNGYATEASRNKGIFRAGRDRINSLVGEEKFKKHLDFIFADKNIDISKQNEFAGYLDLYEAMAKSYNTGALALLVYQDFFKVFFQVTIKQDFAKFHDRLIDIYNTLSENINLPIIGKNRKISLAQMIGLRESVLLICKVNQDPLYNITYHVCEKFIEDKRLRISNLSEKDLSEAGAFKIIYCVQKNKKIDKSFKKDIYNSLAGKGSMPVKFCLLDNDLVKEVWNLCDLGEREKMGENGFVEICLKKYFEEISMRYNQEDKEKWVSTVIDRSTTIIQYQLNEYVKYVGQDTSIKKTLFFKKQNHQNELALQARVKFIFYKWFDDECKKYFFIDDSAYTIKVLNKVNSLVPGIAKILQYQAEDEGCFISDSKIKQRVLENVRWALIQHVKEKENDYKDKSCYDLKCIKIKCYNAVIKTLNGDCDGKLKQKYKLQINELLEKFQTSDLIVLKIVSCIFDNKKADRITVKPLELTNKSLQSGEGENSDGSLYVYAAI